MSRAYQARFVDELLPGAWLAGHKSVLLALPVGAGKTRCSRLVVQRLLSMPRWDVAVVDHRKELTEQFSAEFADLSPGVFWAGKPSPVPSPLRIGGRDTLIRREWVPLHDKLFLVIDECHHVAERNTYGRLIQRFRTLYRVVYVLGLTATPYRLDGKPLGKVFDTLIEPTKPGDLIDAGVLMEPVILRRDAPDLEGLHRAAGDFIGTELEIRSRKLVGNVVEELKNWSDGYPAVLRAVSIAHSKTLCERLTAAGFRAAHMDGGTPATERDELFARLAIGGQRGAASGIDVLCQVDIASEGWNPPSDYERVLRLPYLWPSSDNPPPYVPLCVLSDCRPTLSRSGYRQFEGRGSRPTGDTIQTSRGPMAALPKPWFRLISHSENWRRFGFLRDHYGFSLETGEVAGEARQPRDKSGLLNCRYCPKCLSVWPNTVAACSCGTALIEPKATPEETREKFVPVGATQGATDGQRVGYLVGLWLSHFKKNAARAATGQPLVSERQIAAIYHSYSGRWPTTADMQAAKAAALSTKNAAKPSA